MSEANLNRPGCAFPGEQECSAPKWNKKRNHTGDIDSVRIFQKLLSLLKGRVVQAASASEHEWNKAIQAATFSNKTSRSREGHKLPLEAKPVSGISPQRKKTLFYFLQIQGTLLFHEWPRPGVSTLCLEIKFYWDTALPTYVHTVQACPPSPTHWRAHKAENSHCLALYRTSLLTPQLHYQPPRIHLEAPGYIYSRPQAHS